MSARLLPPKQQTEMMSLVSTTTGQPIERTSPADPAGFGLGVQQGTTAKFGTFWTYTGGTLGFRTLHVYLPASGVIMAIGLNSQPTQGRTFALAEAVYDTLLAHGTIRPVPVPAGPPRPGHAAIPAGGVLAWQNLTA